MTAIVDNTPRQKALGPHDLARRVPCTICLVETGAPCRDNDGTERNDPHHSRWIRYQHLMRQRPFTAIVREAVDERLSVGDVLLCVATREPRTLRVLADGRGSQGGPEVIDAGAVEFRAFIEETVRTGPGRHPRPRPGRRPHLGATA